MTDKDKFYAHDRLEVSTEWPYGYDIAIFDRYGYQNTGMSIAQAKQLVDALTSAIKECDSLIAAYEAEVEAERNEPKGSESVIE
jgi:hypothetical protein